MVKAKTILIAIAIVVAIIGKILIQTAPHQKQAAYGYYFWGAAATLLLIAGILQAIEWTRKHVRIL